jgi:DsbC/DsbD-like thiol-disulfide interchange protein/cytochrome c biogenesis protein CcdA
MKTTERAIPAGLLLVCLFAALPLWAQSPAEAPAETLHRRNIDVSLLSAVDTVVPGRSFDVAVRLAPDPGWHSYWRNPGDTGLPTRIAWRLPRGGHAGPIEWPVPVRVNFNGLINYGYNGDVLLLTRITPPKDLKPGTAWPIAAEVNWLICKDVCIPGSGRVALTLHVSRDGTAAASRWTKTLKKARQQLPRTLHVPKARFHLADAMIIDLPGISDRVDPGAPLHFFPVDKGIVDNAVDPDIHWQNGGVRIRVPKSSEFQGTPPGHFNGLLVVGRGEARHGFYFEGREDPSPIPFTEPGGTGGIGLVYALLLALAGGFILNLMPCVFPVLSLKILSLIKSGSHEPRQRRLHGLAYTAGILVSILVFGVVVLGIRAAGESVGWGFQLQSPWFVAALTYVLFIMGLVLSGLIEPGASLSRAGNLLQSHDGLAGSFLSGVLATLVATPCTVPFMATAMGYALIQPAPAALAVFAVLGLGLASPFLLVAFVPALARHLPKPGRWMQTLKQFLAFPLYLSVVWLLWVLNRQTDANVLALVLIGLVLIAFALWLWRLAGGRRALAARILAVAALLTAIGLLPGLGTPVPPASRNTAPAGADTEPYSKTALDNALAAGRPVFVNIGADWCITCKVNERYALDSKAVRDAFARHHVLYLVGDWTNGDETLTRVLRSFDRPGVPLYLLYLPGRDNPLVLPQLLTPDLIVAALNGRS